MTKEQAGYRLGIEPQQVMKLAKRLEIEGVLRWMDGEEGRRVHTTLTDQEVDRIARLQHKLRLERAKKSGRKPNPRKTPGKRPNKGDDDGHGGKGGHPG